MPRNDDALLLDMLLACRKIQEYTDGLSQDDMRQSNIVQSAVIREFQVLGEAARMISDETKDQYSQIPWGLIAGMRNTLVHEYFRIRLDVVWETVERDLPSLIEALDKIVSSEEDE